LIFLSIIATVYAITCNNNGICEEGEDPFFCASDCASQPYCGDGICDPNEQGNCPADCNSCIPTNGGIEICDNVDNDCDGSIDENLVRSCSNECFSGTQ